jgi:hypothetical protein
MKLTTHRHLTLTSRMVELNIHSPLRLHGIVLSFTLFLPRYVCNCCVHVHGCYRERTQKLGVYTLIQCVPITRKLRNAAGRISVYSALSLVAPVSCSESVTVQIKKVHVGVILLRAQFNFARTSAEYVASRPSDAKFPRI